MLNRVHETCIVVESLENAGGAERIATWLANTWSCAGKSVNMIALGMGEAEPFFHLAPEVKLRSIWSGRSGRNLLESSAICLSQLVKLRKALRDAKPNCVISFLDKSNIITLLASLGLKNTVIVSERTDPHGRRLPHRWELLRRLTYPWADSLVVQSEHALSFFPARVRSRARVIPNPVLLPNGEQGFLGKVNPAKPHRILLGLGSLRDVKGFDRLIEAFSRVAAQHPEWNLDIYGEGPCRPELERQVSRLGLVGRVHLPGVTRDPYARLCEAELFALSSKTEGFPNALAEAMACGLPVISFDCNSGPGELIRDGVDGLLVPEGDVGGLAKQIDRLMGDPAERARFARRAPEVLQRFSSERVLAMWEQAIMDAAKHGPGIYRQ